MDILYSGREVPQNLRSLYTNHGLVLMRVWIDSEATLAEIAAAIGVREGAAYRIVRDLEQEGFILKEKVGRRNRYHVNVERALDYQPLPGMTIRQQIVALATTIGLPAREVAAAGR